ncbi:MAG TPA: molybdate ABC transporter substrate-binding protein [Methylomirabilota bacterium]
MTGTTHRWRVLRNITLGAVAWLVLGPCPGWSEETVRLHAAGSLRGALTEVAEAFSRAYPVTVKAEFGASGLLRERLERGEAADVFASANMEHPLLLSRQGKAGPVVLFARNELCALARPGLSVTSASLLERMLDPAIKLGTSTPRADPSGDYAWEVFHKADGLRPGSREALEKKALQLTGGPNSPRPPGNRGVYGWVMEQGQADLFLTYCTNARSTASQVAGLQVITLPPPLAVGADYGLTVLTTAQPDKALKLAMFILSPEGQEILARHGFTAPTRPAP